jgi:hypothetical protein
MSALSSYISAVGGELWMWVDVSENGVDKHD